MRVECGALLLGVCLCLPFASSQTPPKEMKTGPTTVSGRTLSQWRQELTHPDASRRAEAVIAITGFGDANAECVPALISVTHDKDVSPRVRAVIAMRMVAVDDRDVGKVINALVARLDVAKESQAIVRLEASVSLKRFVGESALNSAVAGLIKGTRDGSSWEIRHHCVATLWRVGKEQKSGTDASIYEGLLAVLERREETYLVRLETLQGLGALGRSNNPLVLSKVIAKLDAFTRSENKPLAIWAFSGLVAMHEGKAAESSLAAIAKFLRSERLETRIQAANALGALGARAKSRVPMLLVMLDDPEANGVWAACHALGAIGDSSDKVVDALLKLVGHKEPSRAAAGVTALVILHADRPRVMAALDKMRENKELDNRLRGVIDQGLLEMKKPKK